jgi:hypothetical protein
MAAGTAPDGEDSFAEPPLARGVDVRVVGAGEQRTQAVSSRDGMRRATTALLCRLGDGADADLAGARAATRRDLPALGRITGGAP